MGKVVGGAVESDGTPSIRYNYKIEYRYNNGKIETHDYVNEPKQFFTNHNLIKSHKAFELISVEVQAVVELRSAWEPWTGQDKE